VHAVEPQRHAQKIKERRWKIEQGRVSYAVVWLASMDTLLIRSLTAPFYPAI
jgi:hypothetical protein